VNEEVRTLLEELHDEEQYATKLFKSAQERKQQLLKEQQEQKVLEEQVAQQAYLEELKKVPVELSIMGVSYKKLRDMLNQHQALKVLYLHRDVRNLLVAAIPSKNEEHFYQLVSALVQRLVGIRTEARSIVACLRQAEATRHYFGVSDAVSIPIAAVGIVLGTPSALLSDLVTTWALEYGRLTNYEGNE
jgi:hypothetical protein